MRDHEVADRLILMERVAVEARHDVRIYRVARQQREQTDDRRLDQMDRGRFERFEKAASEPDRDAIAVPDRLAMPRDETQPVGFGERRAGDARAQQRLGRVMVPLRARIDMAVSSAVLERDSTLPPRPARGRTRYRRGIAL